ncbi:SNARE_assoc domain-containing protein [Cephalotus follicularis]|uniref:SNARE_assoc domain-containing protein n=1 Tax=Cephalotus follicularis TaxID=3775 RepID=A0A1Q3B5M9_CEPFO|nr:SNARE_assoc domain-containing protein [Cephalotus follicularis]
MPTLTSLHHQHLLHLHFPFKPKSSLPFISKPIKLFHALKPLISCSSLTKTNRQEEWKQAPLRANTSRHSFRGFLSPKSDCKVEDEGVQKSGSGGCGLDRGYAFKGTILASLVVVFASCGFGYFGYVYKDQINVLLTQLSHFIEGYGPVGYALFVAVYAALEILAVPSTPLAMSAGLLFGTSIGTLIVLISATVAATAGFLIARYFARERILTMVKGNKEFLAIDKAIGENAFRVVTLLRMSPLLPFSLGNYLYGLTSVKFVPYILGSWLGMLPATWAYVSAGAIGRAIIQEESGIGLSGRNGQFLTLGVGLLATALAAAYVTRLAKEAIKDIE